VLSEKYNHGDYNYYGGNEICDEIETAFDKIQESRKSKAESKELEFEDENVFAERWEAGSSN